MKKENEKQQIDLVRGHKNADLNVERDENEDGATSFNSAQPYQKSHFRTRLSNTREKNEWQRKR